MQTKFILLIPAGLLTGGGHELLTNSSNKSQLAELLGILLSDCHLHKFEYRVTIVGSLDNRQYYKDTVLPLLRRFSGKEAKIRNRNDRNAIYVEINKKQFVQFLQDSGLVRGNKIFASIPSMIIQDESLIPCFLRGLFDTDGSFKFQKQSMNIHYYPRIQFCFKKGPLSVKLKELITSLNFCFLDWIDKRGPHYYHISGSKNLHNWMKLIGMNNLVHKTKYLLWKKQRFYMPKSTLIQRQKALNL